MTLPMILAFLISAAVSIVVGKLLIPFLRAKKAGQRIRTDGPVWHMSKQGTPTMGGIIFISGIAIVMATIGVVEIVHGELRHIFVFALALIFGFIGFLDDYEKLKKKQNLGLTAIQKLLLQAAAAIVFVIVLKYFGYLKPSLYIPFANVTLHIPEAVYLIFAAFVMVGCVNAVNITDGVDGLVTGVSLPVGLFFAAVSIFWKCTGVGIFSAALVGGLAAFLIFNFNPAKIFMGDTGSLFLGGAVCGLAFALDMPLVLIPVGIVYVVETLSDIIQVMYFKITHGKRLFRMAPLHHHFEMGGWSEKKLFVVFTSASLLFAVISFFGVYARY